MKDFKIFRESNNWTEHKDTFLVAVNAQNLNHLIDKNHTVIDHEMDAIQKKHMHKVLKDCFLYNKAKVIIKAHVKDKDARIIGKEICEVHDDLIPTSVNADAILAWPTVTKFHLCDWNKSYGEFIMCNGSQLETACHGQL